MSTISWGSLAVGNEHAVEVSGEAPPERVLCILSRNRLKACLTNKLITVEAIQSNRATEYIAQLPFKEDMGVFSGCTVRGSDPGERAVGKTFGNIGRCVWSYLYLPTYVCIHLEYKYNNKTCDRPTVTPGGGLVCRIRKLKQTTWNILPFPSMVSRGPDSKGVFVGVFTMGIY